MACVTLRNMTLCLLWLSNLADLGHISSEISVRIKIDIVEQPCKVTALHYIGNYYGGLGGGGIFFAADGTFMRLRPKSLVRNLSINLFSCLSNAKGLTVFIRPNLK
eukprot:sb/3477791/